MNSTRGASRSPSQEKSSKGRPRRPREAASSPDDNVIALSSVRAANGAQPARKGAKRADRARPADGDAKIGHIVRLDSEGDPVVAWGGAPDGVHARSLVDLGASSVGASVALLFEGGHEDKPIVLGLLRKEDRRRAAALEVLVDGRRIALEAEREIVLRSGKASITLTRAGKIILRGTHVVSRSSGANRVQGSQVRIN